MTFPSNFHWGVATSAYQIEGAVDEGGRGRTDWDEFARQPGNIHRGDTAEVSADHYHRYRDDLAMLTELGVDSYRLSISWTRVIPDGTGQVNQEGLDFYSRVIDEPVDRGITPLITLNHMELPLPLAQAGGWSNRATVDAFVRYATVVHAALRDRVTLWSTFNELALLTWFGVGTLYFPPALNDRAQVAPTMHHFMLAHARAVQAMRQQQPDGSFGLVGSYWPILPATTSEADAAAAAHLDDLFNRSCLDVLVTGHYPVALLDYHDSVGGQPFIQDGDLDGITGTVDWFGLNYYNPVWVAADPDGAGGPGLPTGLGARQIIPTDLPMTAFGWPIHADGLRLALLMLQERYALPVWITENGAAFDDYLPPNADVLDDDRIDYFQQHLTALEAAIDAGVQVRGYFAWSLIDNFEWAEGYSKRFGLVYIDYSTQRRIPKKSFHWYRDRIAEARAVHG